MMVFNISDRTPDKPKIVTGLSPTHPLRNWSRSLLISPSIDGVHSPGLKMKSYLGILSFEPNACNCLPKGKWGW